MALAPSSSGLVAAAQNALASGWQSLMGMFSTPDFSPEAALAETPGIDPRFLPRVPMHAANIDMSVLAKLGAMGLKHGKEITAQTHPELYHVWSAMSARAGLKRVPQLILAESAIVNAMTISPEEVVVTTGLLKLMNFRELTAVLGHELGHGSSNHIKPRVMAMSIFAVGGGVIGDSIANRGGIGHYIAHDVPNAGRFRRAMTQLFGRGDKPLSLLSNAWYILVGGGIGSVVANQISVRPTELDADKKGATISGDPQGLISALFKLDTSRHPHAFKRFFAYLRSGYPTTETRIARLREIASSMPPTVPVVASIEPLSAAMPDVPSVPLASAAPSAQISHITEAERVSAPVPAPVTAL